MVRRYRREPDLLGGRDPLAGRRTTADVGGRDVKTEMVEGSLFGARWPGGVDPKTLVDRLDAATSTRFVGMSAPKGVRPHDREDGA
jgi:hypothetical protein